MIEQALPGKMKPTPKCPHFPFSRDEPFQPPRQYQMARESDPFCEVTLWDGTVARLVTRYDDLKAVLSDPRVTAQLARPGFPAISEGRVAVDKQERGFIGMDNPEHDYFRRMLTREFTAKRMEAMRPKIREIIDSLIDKMLEAGPPADLVSAFAIPLPSMVMCGMMGTPYEDHTIIMKFQSQRHSVTAGPEVAAGASRGLVDYVRGQIDEKEKNPGDDLFSRVIRDYVQAGQLSKDDLAEMGALLLRAGHDTTANMVALGTTLFLQHPEQLELLKADPSLAPQAVEELLRFLSPVQYAPRRMATEDITISNVTIPKGQGIFTLVPSANRDASAFENPDTFDIRRDASHQVAFGYGIHQCLGQPLARVELQEVFSVLFRRFPTLRLAVPFEELEFRNDMQVYGLRSLPIAW
jgi:cytochrome P450